MYGNPYFGVNNAMSVDATKQGQYGQNAMVLPGAYGGDPYSVVGNSPVGASGMALHCLTLARSVFRTSVRAWRRFCPSSLRIRTRG